VGETLLFVHGTGVRAERYSATLAVIKRGVERHNIPVEVAGCFWGEAEGAHLRVNGASIPSYARTGGNRPDEQDELLALWSLLYTDPWYELRLLRHMPVTEEAEFGEEPASVLLHRAVVEFAPSGQLTADLTEAGLKPRFTEALEALQTAPEFRQAAQTAPPDPLEHRRAIARALIARAMVAAEEAGAPPIDGETRDAVVERLSNELNGYGMGVGEFLLRPVKGLAMRMATWKLTHDRGGISDSTAPMAGDVLRFLASGDGLREFIREALADFDPGPVYLLGHSLGGIACVDLLIRDEIPSVRRLVTVGSQAPLLYETGALPALAHPDSLPDHFPAWLNIYDRRDILSYVGAGVLGDRVEDVEVDNRQPFPYSHSAYWTNADVWKAIKAVIG
jgi:hypothetical protein